MNHLHAGFKRNGVQPFSAPTVSPLTINRWASKARITGGAMAIKTLTPTNQN